jgi:hypothetical protein
VGQEDTNILIKYFRLMPDVLADFLRNVRYISGKSPVVKFKVPDWSKRVDSGIGFRTVKELCGRRLTV